MPYLAFSESHRFPDEVLNAMCVCGIIFIQRQYLIPLYELDLKELWANHHFSIKRLGIYGSDGILPLFERRHGMRGSGVSCREKTPPFRTESEFNLSSLPSYPSLRLSLTLLFPFVSFSLNLVPN
jgi:hypothetical protein